MLSMNKQQVMKFLPHRDPFLFIDEVVGVKLAEGIGIKQTYTMNELVGATVSAKFQVSPELTVLEGHFPGRPILPGVVQVEMMAQASSFLCFLSMGKPLDEVKIEVALLGVDRSRFRKPVIPPMSLDIHAMLTKARGGIMTYDCSIHSAGEVVSESSILASLKIL